MNTVLKIIFSIIGVLIILQLMFALAPAFIIAFLMANPEILQNTAQWIP